jgi:hypothetical protein
MKPLKRRDYLPVEMSEQNSRIHGRYKQEISDSCYSFMENLDKTWKNTCQQNVTPECHELGIIHTNWKSKLIEVNRTKVKHIKRSPKHENLQVTKVI